MALAETARLVARLDLGGNFLSQIGKVNKSVSGLDRLVAKSGDRWYKAGTQVGTGILRGAAIAAGGIGLITTQVALGLRSLAELEVLTGQTEAVLKSTGGVAGITASKVAELSKKYEALGGVIDDKVIQNSENLLLTFTNVRKDGFEPALKAILNMNTALGGGEEGLQKNTILVGKALQDPIRGLTALRRVGVNFTKDQEKMIKALVETGDVMGAQKIIIAELDREFGGSFLAKGDITAGKIGRFKESIESLQEALAKALLPTIGKVADKLAAFLSQPGTIRAVEELGGKIASLFSDENIAKGAGILREAFATIQSVLPGLKDAAEVSGRVLSTAVGLFRSLPPEIQKLAIGALAVNKLTGGLVTNLAGGLLGFALKNLRTITAANVTVIGANVTGGGGGLPDAVGKTGLLATLAAALPIIIGASLPLIMLAALKAVGLGEADRGPGGTGGLNQPGPRAHIPISGAIPVVVVTPGSRSGSGSTGAPGSRSRSGLGATAAATFGPHSIAGSLFTSTLAELIAGIKKRSAARFGGSGLGASAVDATFQRDILRAAGEVATSSAGLSTKVGDLKSLQSLLTQNGDTAAAKKIQALIDNLTPNAIGLAVAKAMPKNVSLSPDDRGAIRASASAQRAAAEAQRTAGRAINVSVNVSTKVTVRDYVRESHIVAKYGKVIS